ncbi:MAG: hypothetical protein R3B47_20460 [Bacteroidia bacterium]
MAHHEQHFTEEQLTESYSFDGKLRNRIFITMAVGLVLLVIGFFTYNPGHHAEEDHDDHGGHAQVEQLAPPTVHKVQDDHSDDHAGEGEHQGETHQEEAHHEGDDHADEAHHEGDDHGAEAHAEHAGHDDHGHHNHALPLHPVTKLTGLMGGLIHGGLFWFMLAMGSFFFIAVHRLGNAGWQTAIKRVPEAMASYIGVGGAILLIIAVIAVITKQPFDWMYAEPGSDHIIDSKRGFLNIPFLARAHGCISGCLVFSD